MILRCRLFLSLSCNRRQASVCSSIFRERELGLDRLLTGLSTFFEHFHPSTERGTCSRAGTKSQSCESPSALTGKGAPLCTINPESVKSQKPLSRLPRDPYPRSLPAPSRLCNNRLWRAPLASQRVETLRGHAQKSFCVSSQCNRGSGDALLLIPSPPSRLRGASTSSTLVSTRHTLTNNPQNGCYSSEA